MTQPTSHHTRFMQEALSEARTALDKGEFPVGCVITRHNRIISRSHRTNSRHHGNELDHAEVTALRTLLQSDQGGEEGPLTVYATMEPCLMCFAALILNNVRTIVYAYEDAMGGGTALDLNTLPPLYRGMKITIIPHLLRRESLTLFKDFFNNPQNDYWPDSMLAHYTLNQP